MLSPGFEAVGVLNENFVGNVFEDRVREVFGKSGVGAEELAS